MNEGYGPLVTVLTPVYNGEKYLAGCIASVVAQTYQNWEYVIVNNCSADRSLEIAQEYARRDRRIRIHNNEEFVGAIRNHNIGFAQMAPGSRYCKIIHADDWLFPECIARMVEVAEANRSVGIVSSYALKETRVKGDGLPRAVTVVPGREVCRRTLFQDYYVFLSPSCLLIRADFIRAAHGAFYNEAHIHADVEACFEVLQRSDLGFVHQVLTFVRAHEDSLSGQHARPMNSYLPAWIDILTRYGRTCLSEDEYQQLLRRRLREYDRFLGRSIFRLRDRKFWRFHAEALEALGYSFSWARVVRAAAVEAFHDLSPLGAVVRALGALREQRGPGVP